MIVSIRFLKKWVSLILECPNLLFLLIINIIYFIQINHYGIMTGRDFWTYEYYYHNLLISAPESPLVMLFRTPGVPIFFGILFDLFGEWGVRIVLYISYIVCNYLIFRIVCHYSKFMAFLTLFLIGVNFNHFEYWHSIASESVSSIMVILWFSAVYIFRNKGSYAWVALAILTFIMVLVRPAHQVLLIIVLMPFLAPIFVLKSAIFRASSFMGVYLVLHIAFCSYNYVRYDQFAVAKLGNAHLPFYRLFVNAKIIRPDIGPASEELNLIVQDKVFSEERYQKYQISTEKFYSAGTSRFYTSIVKYVLEEKGLDTKLFSQVSMEAMSRYPLSFWLSYLDSLKYVFDLPNQFKWQQMGEIYTDFDQLLDEHYAWCKEQGLPVPDELDLVPGKYSFHKYLPDGYEVNTNYIWRVFNNYQPASWTWKEYDRQEWLLPLSNIMRKLNPSSYWFVFLFLVGFIFQWKDPKMRQMFILWFAIMLIVLISIMASVQKPFRFPFDPVFITMGIIGFKLITDRFQELFKDRNRE